MHQLSSPKVYLCFISLVHIYCLSSSKYSKLCFIYCSFLFLLSPSNFPRAIWFIFVCIYCFCLFLLEEEGNRCMSVVCYLEQQVNKDEDRVKVGVWENGKKLLRFLLYLIWDKMGGTEYTVKKKNQIKLWLLNNLGKNPEMTIPFVGENL